MAIGDKFEGYKYFDTDLNDTLLNEIVIISKINKNFFVEKFYNYNPTRCYDGYYYSASISKDNCKKKIVYFIPSDLPENLRLINDNISNSFTTTQKRSTKEFDFDTILIKTININLNRIYHFPYRQHRKK